MSCLIFIHYEGAKQALFRKICSLFDNSNNADLERCIIDGPDYNIDLRLNKDGYPDGMKIPYYEYRGFKYYLDFYSSDSLKEVNMIAIISTILNFLWDNNIPAVAECEFEDRLPREGGAPGYDIPWPQ